MMRRTRLTICLSAALAAPAFLLVAPAAAQDLLWTRQLGTSAWDQSRAVAVDSEGNAYVSGSTRGSLGGPSAGDYDAFLAKYDAAGALLWTRQLGTSADDGSYAVAVDSAGNAYMSGSTEGSLGGPSAGGADAFLAQHDASGALLWSRQLGTSADDGSYAVAVDSAGNAYISGDTEGSLGGPSAGGADAFLARYDASGAPLWTRQFGTSAWDQGRAVAVDSAGNAYTSGSTEGSLGGSGAGLIDAFLAGHDASGALLWSRQLGTSADDRSYALAVDSAGNAYTSGESRGSLGGPGAGDYDAFLAKYGDATCPADCDGDGELTFFDFLCFQNLFATGDPGADCDGDGALTFFDFLCFQNAFAAGCP
ncbi:MAG: SBBP repeat-containing protein [Phycisphaerales bacterium JB039]